MVQRMGTIIETWDTGTTSTNKRMIFAFHQTSGCITNATDRIFDGCVEYLTIVLRIQCMSAKRSNETIHKITAICCFGGGQK
jgi:hypothetical protein